MGMLIPLAGMLFALAITPGPNNMILMRAALAGQYRQAAGLVAGIQLGTVLALLASWHGLTGIRNILSVPAGGMSVAGGMILLSFGLLPLLKGRSASGESGISDSIGFAGMLMFQLLNPKSWLLVGSAVAMAQASPDLTVLMVVSVFVLVTLTCQAVWVLAGKALTLLLREGYGLSEGFGLAANVTLVAMGGFMIAGSL